MNRGRKYAGTFSAAIRCQLFLALLICLPLKLSKVDLISLALAETPGTAVVPAPANPLPGAAQTGVGQNGAESQATGSDSAIASEPTTSQPAGQLSTSNTGTTAPGQTIVDDWHTEISRSIQGTATWMDSFFGNRRYESEVNQSYVRFRYNVFLEQGSPMIRRPEFQVRIVLPQLQERTHIVFSGSPKEAAQFSALGSNSENTVLTAQEERNVSAAVEQTLRETVKENFLIRAGLQVHHFKPGVMLAPRYRVLFPLDSWNLRFVEELIWRSEIGWESRATIDLERPLPHDLFFRATNEWVWMEHILGYIYAFNFTVGQPIDSRRAIDYEWINIFQTDPVNELTEVDLRVRYRTQIWRPWLFFEVTPQYRFSRNQEFKAVPGVLFRLDLIFGDYKDNH